MALLLKASPALVRRVPSVTRAAIDPDVHRHVSNLTKDLASGPWTRRLESQLTQVISRAESLALTTPPARPAALEWSRRANALLAQLSQTPDDRLALRKHLERVSDQVRQLRWEMERQAR
ncbi:MAG: hypothetical protein V9E81_07670 [Marmoricola sp.]